MQINSKVKSLLYQHAIAAVGTEGLMGNKVIDISPVLLSSPLKSSKAGVYSCLLINRERQHENSSHIFGTFHLNFTIHEFCIALHDI